MQELESSLAKKENCIKELESSLSEQKEVNGRQLNELKLLNDRLSSEARRIKSLEREGDRLRSEIAVLESKVDFKLNTMLMFFTKKFMLGLHYDLKMLL